MAKVTIQKAVRAHNPWENVEEITLKLNVEEVKALIALTGDTTGATIGAIAAGAVYDALVDEFDSDVNQSVLYAADFPAIAFSR